jgi:hypothetical protein
MPYKLIKKLKIKNKLDLYFQNLKINKKYLIFQKLSMMQTFGIC